MLCPGRFGGFYVFVQVLLVLLRLPEGTTVFRYYYSARMARPTLPSSTWADLLCINDHAEHICNEPKVSLNCWIYYPCNVQLIFYKVQGMPK